MLEFRLLRTNFLEFSNLENFSDVEIERFFSFDDTDLIFDFQMFHAMQIPFIAKIMHLIEK